MAGAAAAGLDRSPATTSRPRTSAAAPPRPTTRSGTSARPPMVVPAAGTGRRIRPVDRDRRHQPVLRALPGPAGGLDRRLHPGGRRVGGQARSSTPARPGGGPAPVSAAFGADPSWVARDGKAGRPPGPPVLLQFTSAGTVPGIAASGATDVSCGDRSDGRGHRPRRVGWPGLLGFLGAWAGGAGGAGGAVRGPADRGVPGPGGPEVGGLRGFTVRTAAPVPAAGAAPRRVGRRSPWSSWWRRRPPRGSPRPASRSWPLADAQPHALTCLPGQPGLDRQRCGQEHRRRHWAQ